MGSGGRYTFTNPGECILDRWMAEHAFVTWQEHTDPWVVEHEVLASDLLLPLNIHGNPREVARIVSSIRCEQRRKSYRENHIMQRVFAQPGSRAALQMACRLRTVCLQLRKVNAPRPQLTARRPMQSDVPGP